MVPLVDRVFGPRASGDPISVYDVLGAPDHAPTLRVANPKVIGSNPVLATGVGDRPLSRCDSRYSTVTVDYFGNCDVP